MLVYYIYPNEYEVKDTTDTQMSASYLDRYGEIGNTEWLKTKLYDERDDFTFPIVNLPFISSNIPAYHQRMVFTIHSSYIKLGQKLLKQGDVAPRLKSSLQQFCGHHNLVDR